ncbi:MFS transporter [Bacillaceae bacterium S4-13-56]
MTKQEIAKTLYIMVILAFTSIGMFTFPTLGPLLAKIDNLDPTKIAWFITSFYIGATSCSMLAGYWVDRYGVKLCIMVGGALMAVSLLLTTLPDSFNLKLVFLALTGVGYTLINPSINKVVVNDFSNKIRGTVMSLKQTGLSMGGMLAAGILPTIAVHWGWKVAVYFSVILLLSISAYILIRKLFEDKSRNDQSFLEKNKGVSNDSYHLIYKNKNVLLTSIGGLIIAAAQWIIITFLVLYLQKELSFNYITASFYLAILQFSGLVGRIFWGWSCDYLFTNRKKLFRNLLISSGLFILIFVVLCYFIKDLDHILLVKLILGLIIFLMGFVTNGWNGVFMVVMVEEVTAQLAGKVTGFSMMFVYLGIILGPLLFSFLILNIPYTIGWVIVSTLFFLSAFIFHKV